MKGFEIERRFLIKIPEGLADMSVSVSKIRQTYLKTDGGSERVRERETNGEIKYTHTKKITLSAATRIEEEREISRDEYDALLKKRDTERKTVEKIRHCVENGGRIFEIDVYPFWREVAIMEIELEDENAPFIPPSVEIIREVTGDFRFTNSAIAKEIPSI